MPHIGANPSELRRAKPKDYITRFLFGAAVTLLAALISKWAGPVVGGLFLAFPGIFPPGASEGTFGLIAFAAVLWYGLPRHGLAFSLAFATVLWAAVSFAAWYVRERL